MAYHVKTKIFSGHTKYESENKWMVKVKYGVGEIQFDIEKFQVRNIKPN